MHTAVARRELGILWEMSTMCALPEGVRWVSLGSGLWAVVGVLSGSQEEDFICFVWVEKARETEDRGG